MSARELREKDVRPVGNKLPENYSAREARYMKRMKRKCVSEVQSSPE